MDAEALVRAAFGSAADPVMIADLSGCFVEANPAARGMLGLPGSGPISLPCDMLFAHSGTSDPCFLRRVIVRGETIRDAEEQVVTAGGERRAVLITASPLRSGSGEIAGAVFVLRDAAALEGLYQELRIEASTDELTGLSNRRELDRALGAELSRAERHSKPLAILMIDLDGFKGYNDTNGHLAGDALLKQVGEFLRADGRREDTVARYGGDEFVVLLPESAPEHAAARAERIREGIASLSRSAGRVTASVGLLNWRESCASDPSQVLRLVDGALYEAKSKGEDQVLTCEMPTG